MNKMTELRAVVVGATGATGRQVCRALCGNDRWTSVVAVVRREPAAGELTDGEGAKKMKVLVAALDKPEDEQRLLDGWKGADVLFNCFGTTRAAAGSAAEFKRVEVDLTARAANLAKRAGIARAAVVSANGANAAQKVPSEKLHPLLYMQTMGRKEQAMRDAFGAALTIYRPGMLNVRAASTEPSARVACAASRARVARAALPTSRHVPVPRRAAHEGRPMLGERGQHAQHRPPRRQARIGHGGRCRGEGRRRRGRRGDDRPGKCQHPRRRGDAARVSVSASSP